MLNVGLTGNIGAGKSTVARWFREWGATLIDADELVREVQQPGSETLAAIARQFGADVLKPDGSLNRDLLRNRAMHDAQALTALNEIVHPAVQQRRAERRLLAAERGDCVLVNDVPLLFEVLDPGDFDLVVLVDAPEELRRKRIMEERGLSTEVARQMIGAQLPAAEKRAQSGIVLDNDGTLEELQAAAHDAWRDIRRRAAAKLAARKGTLLAVTTNELDATRAFGGTLARYADAGVETRLLCTGVPAAAEGIAALGLAGTSSLDVPQGGLAEHEATIVAAVARAMHEHSPDVTITLGASESTGAPLGAAVRGGWNAAGSPGALFHTTRTHDGSSVHARLDVRPWRDVQRAVLAALGDTADTTAVTPSERETYTAAEPPKHPLVDLFASAD